MAWYKEGRVAVQSGSRAVVGVGTSWLKQVVAGEGLDVLDGRLHEIAEVISNTELLLVDAYAGVAATGVAYQVIPSASMTKELTRRVNTLIASHEKASVDVLQAAAQAKENAEAAADSAGQAAGSAQSADVSQRTAAVDSDSAMGYRNEASSAKTIAVQKASDAAGSAVSATQSAAAAGSSELAAKGFAESIDPEKIKDRANHTGVQGIATIAGLSAATPEGVMAALAMAATFTAVPATFQAACIVVTQPHLRFMYWSSIQNKYVRAPWHPVGRVVYSYGAALSGALPIRADLSYNQTDYPDLAAYLGLSGTGTFSLIEARGEFLRVLDNGRGKDVGRVIRSTQAGAVGPHNHLMNIQASDNTPGYGAFKLTANTEGTGNSGSVTGSSETRPDNIALPLWLEY